MHQSLVEALRLTDTVSFSSVSRCTAMRALRTPTANRTVASSSRFNGRYVANISGTATLLDVRRPEEYDASKAVDRFWNRSDVKKAMGVPLTKSYVACSPEVRQSVHTPCHVVNAAAKRSKKRVCYHESE